jgi:predicted secreted Zn-dependent protease
MSSWPHSSSTGSKLSEAQTCVEVSSDSCQQFRGVAKDATPFLMLLLLREQTHFDKQEDKQKESIL